MPELEDSHEEEEEEPIGNRPKSGPEIIMNPKGELLFGKVGGHKEHWNIVLLREAYATLSSPSRKTCNVVHGVECVFDAGDTRDISTSTVHKTCNVVDGDEVVVDSGDARGTWLDGNDGGKSGNT